MKKLVIKKKWWSNNQFFVIRPWTYEPDFTVKSSHDLLLMISRCKKYNEKVFLSFFKKK